MSVLILAVAKWMYPTAKVITTAMKWEALKVIVSTGALGGSIIGIEWLGRILGGK